MCVCVTKKSKSVMGVWVGGGGRTLQDDASLPHLEPFPVHVESSCFYMKLLSRFHVFKG